MPPECINYSTDIKDTASFTDEEVKMVMDGVSDENLKCLIGIRKDILHSNAHLNMKKSSSRQKKNYDLKNAMPTKLSVGDLMLKIKQKNLSRKEGRKTGQQNRRAAISCRVNHVQWEFEAYG